MNNQLRKPELLQRADKTVRLRARTLVRQSRSGSLATLNPESGAPAASHTLVCVDPDGAPVILLSGLSSHFKALEEDKRASLLLRFPGKGDPLAHPRITINAHAHKVTDQDEHARLRARCLLRHPKSSLYVDLPDFAFWRLEPQNAGYVEGFGRAYALSAADLVTPSPFEAELSASEARIVEHMNDDHADAVELYATVFLKAEPGRWMLAGADAHGLDLVLRDQLLRLWFEAPLTQASAMKDALVDLVKQARLQTGT